MAFRPATTRIWYEMNAISCDSATTAGVLIPAAGNVCKAALSPSTGRSVSARVKDSMARRRPSGNCSGAPSAATAICAASAGKASSRAR